MEVPGNQDYKQWGSPSERSPPSGIRTDINSSGPNSGFVSEPVKCKGHVRPIKFPSFVSM